jgi:hypothetical protein
MRKVFIFIGVFVLIFIPILFVILRNPAISTLFPKKQPASTIGRHSEIFSAKSDLPGYSLNLSDPAYLDKLVEHLGLF